MRRITESLSLKLQILILCDAVGFPKMVYRRRMQPHVSLRRSTKIVLAWSKAASQFPAGLAVPSGVSDDCLGPELHHLIQSQVVHHRTCEAREARNSVSVCDENPAGLSADQQFEPVFRHSRQIATFLISKVALSEFVEVARFQSCPKN